MNTEKFPEKHIDFIPNKDDLNQFFLRLKAEAISLGGEVYGNFPEFGFKIGVKRDSNIDDLLASYLKEVQIHDAKEKLK